MRVKNTIINIGGGAASVMHLARFVKQPEEDLPLESRRQTLYLIITKGESYAFSSTLPDTCSTNLPAGSMSLEKNPKDEWYFPRWLVKNGYTEDAFPPRKLYGKYLNEYQKYLVDQGNATGLTIKIIANKVVDVQRDAASDDINVYTETGDVYPCQYVILTAGHGKPSDPFHLSGHPNFIFDPYNLPPELPPGLVGVLGTGITAVDVLKSLAGRQILAASRRGQLPAILPNEIGDIPPLKAFTVAQLDRAKGRNMPRVLKFNDVKELFCTEMSLAYAAAGVEIDPTEEALLTAYRHLLGGTPEERLTMMIDTARRGMPPWQKVLFALYPMLAPLWRDLEVKAKRFIIKFIRPEFIRLLAATPLKNALVVQKMLSEKTLEIRGGLENVTVESDGQFLLSFSDGSSRKVTTLVNATGAGVDPMKVPLYRRLIEKNHAKCGDFGGLLVDEHHRLLTSSGPTYNMFAMGAVTLSGSSEVTVPSASSGASAGAGEDSTDDGIGPVPPIDDLMEIISRAAAEISAMICAQITGKFSPLVRPFKADHSPSALTIPIPAAGAGASTNRMSAISRFGDHRETGLPSSSFSPVAVMPPPKNFMPRATSAPPMSSHDDEHVRSAKR